MFDVVGKRFFETLQTVSEEKLGADHPCTQAAACAVKSGAQVDIERAQTQLSELRPQLAEALIEAVHKAMREDPNALLNFWNAPGSAHR